MINKNQVNEAIEMDGELNELDGKLEKSLKKIVELQSENKGLYGKMDTMNSKMRYMITKCELLEKFKSGFVDSVKRSAGVAVDDDWVRVGRLLDDFCKNDPMDYDFVRVGDEC